MSKAKDRARAELGYIFRDGHLVRKEDWLRAHPTKQMRAERQVGVDEAVTAEMANKFEQKLTMPADIKSYFCSQCQHKHNVGGKIFIAHRQYARTPLGLA